MNPILLYHTLRRMNNFERREFLEYLEGEDDTEKPSCQEENCDNDALPGEDYCEKHL